MLYSGSHQPGKMADEPSKTISQVSEDKGFKGEFQVEGYMRCSTVSSNNHPETGHAVVWSASPWMDYFKQLIFSSRVGVFPFH